MSSTSKGFQLATAAAAVAFSAFAMTATPALAADKAMSAGDKVHCMGVNSCKGQSDCKSGNHDCKGLNACKGQGMKDMSAEACTKAGGKVG